MSPLRKKCDKKNIKLKIDVRIFPVGILFETVFYSVAMLLKIKTSRILLSNKFVFISYYLLYLFILNLNF